MLMVGGVLALLIRAELFQPGLQIVNPELFNQLTTMHGLIMVFGAIMPAFVGFANWMMPLQIGASDMAFARMNNFSFWLLIPAASCWWARSSCPAARRPPAGRCMRR
jgi:cytochrome c oxidase subunit 1